MKVKNYVKDFCDLVFMVIVCGKKNWGKFCILLLLYYVIFYVLINVNIMLYLGVIYLCVS